MESQGNEFEGAGTVEDPEIDVVECSNNADVPVDHDPDATEYSSSFGGTDTDSENCSGMSTAEAESQFSGEGVFSPSFDAFDGVFRARLVFLVLLFSEFGMFIGIYDGMGEQCNHIRLATTKM